MEIHGDYAPYLSHVWVPHVTNTLGFELCGLFPAVSCRTITWRADFRSFIPNPSSHIVLMQERSQELELCLLWIRKPLYDHTHNAHALSVSRREIAQASKRPVKEWLTYYTHLTSETPKAAGSEWNIWAAIGVKVVQWDLHSMSTRIRRLERKHPGRRSDPKPASRLIWTRPCQMLPAILERIEYL